MPLQRRQLSSVDKSSDRRHLSWTGQRIVRYLIIASECQPLELCNSVRTWAHLLTFSMRCGPSFLLKHSFGGRRRSARLTAEVIVSPWYEPRFLHEGLRIVFSCLVAYVEIEIEMVGRRTNLIEWEINQVCSIIGDMTELNIACCSMPISLWHMCTCSSREEESMWRRVTWEGAGFIWFQVCVGELIEEEHILPVGAVNGRATQVRCSECIVWGWALFQFAYERKNLRLKLQKCFQPHMATMSNFWSGGERIRWHHISHEVNHTIFNKKDSGIFPNGISLLIHTFHFIYQCVIALHGCGSDISYLPFFYYLIRPDGTASIMGHVPHAEEISGLWTTLSSWKISMRRP